MSSVVEVLEAELREAKAEARLVEREAQSPEEVREVLQAARGGKKPSLEASGLPHPGTRER